MLPCWSKPKPLRPMMRSNFEIPIGQRTPGDRVITPSLECHRGIATLIVIILLIVGRGDRRVRSCLVDAHAGRTRGGAKMDTHGQTSFRIELGFRTGHAWDSLGIASRTSRQLVPRA